MVDSPPVRAIVMSTLPSHDSRESLLEQYRSCSTDSSNSTDGSRLSDARAVEQPHHRDPHLDRSVESDVLPETAVLGRNIGWSSAYILIISRVIGSGIFATPGPIVRSVGSIGITLVLWVVGALISWFGLAITREYGCMLPRSGGENSPFNSKLNMEEHSLTLESTGDKVYLKFTYRWPRYLATVLIAVQSILLGFTASNCIVFAEYVLFARGTEASQFEQKALAVGLLTAVVVTHSCLMKTGIFIQNVPGWVKIVLVVFMVFTSLFAVIFRPNVVRDEAQDSSPTTSSKSSLWDGSVWNWGVISTALFKVFYSYAGLQNVNNVPNEVKNPVKTLKSAASTALLTACFLYLLVNVAYFLIVPIEEIKNSGELIAALFFERLFGARVGRILLPSAVAISAAGNVMVVTFSHVRQFTSFEQTLLNQFACSHHSRNRTTRLFTVFQRHLVDETFPCTDGRLSLTSFLLSSLSVFQPATFTPSSSMWRATLARYLHSPAHLESYGFGLTGLICGGHTKRFCSPFGFVSRSQFPC